MTLAIKQGAVKNQARLTILDALADPAILAPWFQGKSLIAWKAFLKALFGLPMGKTTRALYHQHTSRESLPENPSREAWLVVGRRGGKSLMRFHRCVRSFLGFWNWTGKRLPWNSGLEF
jgi:hypothetical protein